MQDGSTPKLHSWDDALGTVLIRLLPPNTAEWNLYQKVLFWSGLTTGTSPMPPLVQTVAGKLHTGLDMRWLDSEDLACAAGPESMTA